MNKVAPTAWLVAWRRAMTDIPYSKEILELVDKPDVPDDLLRPRSTPQFEARYKLVDRLVKESGVKQILELASGLSPRGLTYLGQPVVYIETDLPDVMQQKVDIINKLQVGSATNLYLESVDVLDEVQLEKATRHLEEDMPVAVINEGLMRYLSLDKKRTLALNVYQMLTKYGGVWITPDISLKKIQEGEQRLDKGYISKISSLTGIDIAGNRFDSLEDAKQFFESIGFNVQVHSFLEVTNELSSVKSLSITEEELTALNGSAVVFVMSVR